MTWQLADVPFSLDDLRRDVKYACLVRPEPIDGATDLDPYAFISQPAITRRLGLWISAQLPPDADRLVGVGSSALGLALAAGLEAGIPVAFGETDRMLGELAPGDQAALVADITRSGESAAHTIRLIVEAEAEVVQAFIVWDRGMGALQRLAPFEIPTHVLIEDLPGETGS